MFMAWGFELELKKIVLRAMKECVKLEWCGGMTIILAMAKPRVGLWCIMVFGANLAM